MTAERRTPSSCFSRKSSSKASSAARCVLASVAASVRAPASIAMGSRTIAVLSLPAVPEISNVPIRSVISWRRSGSSSAMRRSRTQFGM